MIAHILIRCNGLIMSYFMFSLSINLIIWIVVELLGLYNVNKTTNFCNRKYDTFLTYCLFLSSYFFHGMKTISMVNEAVLLCIGF